MKRKVTSIKIDPEIWKDAKKHAIDKNISLGEMLEGLIRKELKK